MMENTIDDIEIDLLLEAIYRKYHYDFRSYAGASLKRRLKLACDHYRCDSFSALQGRVLHDTQALEGLLNYMTVQVSEMFRDPHYFKALREKVVPHLKTYSSLKVWIAGCSSGEEVYSLAILFREEGLEERTIFYATDINTEALKKAEAGVYSMDRIPLFTENHHKSGGKSSLSDYYTAAYGNAIFDKTLRKNVVFSDHSLATDAVFAEMHLISCRNVLIYFTRELQERVFGLFQESLIRKGFLGLGAKETIRFSGHDAAFSDADKPARIYQKIGTPL